LPKFGEVYRAIPTFSAVIQEEEDPEILSDAAWAMCYLSDGQPNRVQMVITTGIVPALVRHLDTEYFSILIPTLRTLGNILTGTVAQAATVLEVEGAVEVEGATFDETLNPSERANIALQCCNLFASA